MRNSDPGAFWLSAFPAHFRRNTLAGSRLEMWLQVAPPGVFLFFAISGFVGYPPSGSDNTNFASTWPV